MESLRKNLSAYTLDDAPEDVRELYKDEFIQLYASSIKERRCVKMRTFFFTHKAPTFTSWGFVIT